MFSVSRPRELVVLNCCVTETKLTPHRHAAEREAGSVVVAELLVAMVVLEGLFHLRVRGEGVVEALRAQAQDARHELALEVVLDVALHFEHLEQHFGDVGREREVDGLRRDVELGVQVVERGAVGIQDHALQGAHTQVFQRDGVLVAHLLQLHRHQVR
jgi:hypothetical protein